WKGEGRQRFGRGAFDAISHRAGRRPGPQRGHPADRASGCHTWGIEAGPRTSPDTWDRPSPWLSLWHFARCCLLLSGMLPGVYAIHLSMSMLLEKPALGK